jgi:anti-sigma-K factor RskA
MREDRFHDWDAAYVLGILGPDERREFERHLTTCDACSAAVAELAGMPGILGTLSRDEAVALSQAADDDAHAEHGNPELVTRLAVEAGRRRRRNRLVTAAVGVAAASALIAGGVAIGNSGDSPSQVATVAMTQTRPGVMSANISVVQKSWGTRFDWTCQYLDASWEPGNHKYELVATDDSGTETIVATWNATSRDATTLAASSSVPTSTIRRVEIRVEGSAKPLTTLDL